MTEKQHVISEINTIISEITEELNNISKPAKKQVNNTVYFLSTSLKLDGVYNTSDTVKVTNENKRYAFIIKKSFWFNKMTLELRSAQYDYWCPADNYKAYTTAESLDIFDIESLVIIKQFLLSFAS